MKHTIKQQSIITTGTKQEKHLLLNSEHDTVTQVNFAYHFTIYEIPL